MNDSVPYPIPSGWEWTTLGEICDVVRIQANPMLRPTHKFNYLSIENIESNSGELVNFSQTSGEKIRSSKIEFTTADLLYSKLRPYLNKVHFPTFDGISATDLIPIRPLGGVPREYVGYFLRTRFVLEYTAQKTRGIQLPRVPVEDLLKLPIPLPSLAEQRRIITKLEPSHKSTKTAKETLKRIPSLLQRFRQSVLSKAFRGELTERDPNDEPASELLKRIAEDRRKMYTAECERAKKERRRKPSKFLLDTVPTVEENSLPVDLPDTWAVTTVGFLAHVTKLAGFEYTKYIKLKDTGNVAVVRAQNVQMGRFVEQNIKYISEQTSDILERSQLHGREVLMVFIGAGTGNVCLAPRNGRWHLGPNVAKIDVDGIDPQYLHLYLQSPIGFANTLSRAKATAQQSLSMQTIREILVAVPPIREQKEIVQRVSDFLTRPMQVEETCEKINLDTLTQSILNKAFRGELVPQDPNDEPASVLLERIRAQRATMGKKPVRRKLEELTSPAAIAAKA